MECEAEHVHTMQEAKTKGTRARLVVDVADDGGAKGRGRGGNHGDLRYSVVFSSDMENNMQSHRCFARPSSRVSSPWKKQEAVATDVSGGTA